MVLSNYHRAGMLGLRVLDRTVTLGSMLLEGIIELPVIPRSRDITRRPPAATLRVKLQHPKASLVCILHCWEIGRQWDQSVGMEGHHTCEIPSKGVVVIAAIALFLSENQMNKSVH